jgi:CheY-like chemotaxis protein
MNGHAVQIADSLTAIEEAVGNGPGFDVVIADLTWAGPPRAAPFDGLDVLATLRNTGHPTPVVFISGTDRAERDFRDEAFEQPEVAGIIPKGEVSDLLIEAIEVASHGGTLHRPEHSWCDSPPGVPRIHAYFGHGKGVTAARLAGAIASRRAVNHVTLARAAAVSYDTAAKIVEYLGPLIKGRDEHPADLKMTPEVIYRWCGEHSCYILSWCRRNGHPDFAAPLC